MVEIARFEFTENGIVNIAQDKIYNQKWPIVYVIHNDTEAYVGETVDAKGRMINQISSPGRGNLKHLELIFDAEFNKSATLDIESFLIKYMASDGKYILQNGNMGLVSHDYYQKKKYKIKFDELWDLLIARNLAKKENVLVKTKESIISDGGKVNVDDITINEKTNELVSEAKQSPNSIYIKETAKGPKLLKIDFSSARGLAGKLNNMARSLGKNRKTVLFAAVALILVLGVGIFGFWKVRENAETQKLAEATLTEATNKYDAASIQIGSGNKAAAAETLRNALSLTEGLKSNKKLSTQASDLATKIQTSLDTAEGVLRPEATLVADASQIVGGETFGPFQIGSSLYVVSKADASIASVSTTGGEVSRVLDKPSLDGKIISATAMPVRSVLVFMTDAGKLYEFDTKDVKLNQQTVAGDFEKSIYLASFSTNIYSLDANGKIYKRLKNSSGYSARTEYIVDGSTASGAVSIAIDSNLYAMKTNGEVIQYLGGKKQDYNTTGLPIAISSANNMFTDENTVGLYEIDGNASRVIRYDAKGVFMNQYIEGSYKNASGLYVDDANKILYTVSGGKIYKTTI